MAGGSSGGGFRGGVTQAEFELDTKHMSSAADHCKQLAEKMRDLRSDLEKAKNELLFTWVGYGRDEFEKQYRVLNQQFSDIIEDTKDMYEDLIAAEEAYIQADVDAQKKLDGVDNKF